MTFRDAASLTEEALSESIARADSYLVERRYRGYDPYDALMSPAFRLPFVSGARTVQRFSQQALKRLPVNIRPLLGIQPGLNPVTLGLAIQALAYLGATQPERRDVYRGRVMECLHQLEALQAPGYSGACWGYDFGWQTRQGLFPAGTPTLVATGFVTNGLFTAYRLLGVVEALDLCRSACDFVVNDLRRTLAEDDTLGWSYSPLDDTLVLNATGKAARLLAQVCTRSDDDELRTMARQSIGLLVAKQRADGSWPYAVGDARSWADNFHTGYVLECLREYEGLTGDHSARPAAERGWNHYRRHFFTEELIPRYFDHRTYPVDATACAQSIHTLVTYGDVAAANRVASWSIANLQRADGSFAYQVHRRFTNRIVYVRWSVAWMFSALARLSYEHRTAG
jgi:hypothetical protein